MERTQKLTFTVQEYSSGPRALMPADAETREYLGSLSSHSRVKLLHANPPRSTDQNGLYHVMLAALADQLGWTKEELEAHCKLTHGVPILVAEDAGFAARWEETGQKLPYEAQLKLMSWLPVTRLMSKKQMTLYIDAIIMEFTKQGYYIPMPGDPRA